MKTSIPICMTAFLTTLIAAGCGSNPPVNLGVQDGKLSPCPASPNCVSTQSDDPNHSMEVLRFRGSRRDTMAAILEIVETMERTTIITQGENYLHVEYRTRIGFVDDVEFYLDEKTQAVHFRSASRVGYSDLGVNRKRMEEFAGRYRDLP